MSATLYGTLNAPAWGTQAQDLPIIITNLTKGTSVEETPLKDGDGDVVHTAVHGKKFEISADFLVTDTSKAYPKADMVGATVSLVDTDVETGTFIVLTVDNNKDTEWYKGSLTGITYPDFALTTTTTTTTTV